MGHLFETPNGEFRGINHTVYPADKPAAMELQEGELDPKFGEGTYIVAMTHGQPTDIRSSYDDGDPSNGDDLMTWAEIAAYVARDPLIPLPNLVLMWICSSAQALADSAAAFGMTNRADAAYAGFDSQVSMYLNATNGLPGSTTPLTLDRHSEAVTAGLKSGKRLDQALASANEDYPPAHFVATNPPYFRGANLPMLVAGDCDPFTRLRFVYYSPSEFTTNPEIQNTLKEDWIWFKD